MNMESKNGPSRKRKSRAKGNPIVHESGAKGARDRARAIKHYLDAAHFFKVRPIPDKELAVMTNTQIYRLGEDLFNRQPFRQKEYYFQYLGLRPRANPRALKWYIRDTLDAQGQSLNKAERAVHIIAAVIRYYIAKAKQIKKAPEKAPQQPAAEGRAEVK